MAVDKQLGADAGPAGTKPQCTLGALTRPLRGRAGTGRVHVYSQHTKTTPLRIWVSHFQRIILSGLTGLRPMTAERKVPPSLDPPSPSQL